MGDGMVFVLEKMLKLQRRSSFTERALYVRKLRVAASGSVYSLVRGLLGVI